MNLKTVGDYQRSVTKRTKIHLTNCFTVYGLFTIYTRERVNKQVYKQISRWQTIRRILYFSWYYSRDSEFDKRRREQKFRHTWGNFSTLTVNSSQFIVTLCVLCHLQCSFYNKLWLTIPSFTRPSHKSLKHPIFLVDPINYTYMKPLRLSDPYSPRDLRRKTLWSQVRLRSLGP